MLIILNFIINNSFSNWTYKMTLFTEIRINN